MLTASETPVGELDASLSAQPPPTPSDADPPSRLQVGGGVAEAALSSGEGGKVENQSRKTFAHVYTDGDVEGINSLYGLIRSRMHMTSRGHHLSS